MLSLLNYITWDVSPLLYDGEHFAIWWWALFPVLGAAAYWAVLVCVFKYENKPVNYANVIFIVSAFLGWLFAHVFRCVFYGWYELPDNVTIQGWGIIHHYINPTLVEPLNLFRLNTGLSSHGVDLGIFLGALLCARFLPYKTLWITDRMIVGRLAFQAIARLEFFFMGTVYGYETTMPWGMIFALTGNPHPIHPTFLYETGIALMIMLVWWLSYRKWKGVPQGMLTGICLLLFYVTRFFISFLKQEHMPFEHDWPIHMEQYLCIPYIIAAIIIIRIAIKKGNETPVLLRKHSKK